MIFNYCLAHKAPVIRPPDDCALVELGPDGSVPSDGFARRINAYAVCDYGAEMHPYLGGTLGSFAVLRDLEARNAPETALVNVMHYRRVLLRKRHGRPAPNYPGMRLLVPHEAKELSLDDDHAQLSLPALYTQPQGVKSILRQYQKCHPIADFLRFLGSAVQVGAIVGDEVDQLLTDRVLVPGGVEFGISSVGVYRGIVAQLEATCLDFLKHHRPVDSHPYQQRALNYCAERLGNYLLKKALTNTYGRRHPKRAFGYMHVVSEAPTYVPGN